MSQTQSSLVALQHRNFRLLWLGQLVSAAGSQMQVAAILWHVSLLAPHGQKGLALGIVGLVRFIPIIVFSLISGVVADVLPRRRLLLITQSTMAIIAIVLAAITFIGIQVLWPLYVLTALGAGGMAFDSPARNSLIPTLVPRHHLPNAIGLMTIMHQTASMLGPALAGLIIATQGVAWAYFFNALSFVAVIIAVVLMRDIEDAPADEKNNISPRAAVEGLRFVFSSDLIRSSMLLDFFATLFSSATALLPIFAQDILQIGPQGYGLLTAAPALGALLAGLAMVKLANHIKRGGIVLLWTVVGYGIATVLFGFSRNLWLTFFMLALTGATDAVSTVLRNIIRQLATPDRLRGRMTSINRIFFAGGPQLGELEAGVAANFLGAPFAVVSGGLACIAMVAVVAAKSPTLRNYRQSKMSLMAVTQPVTGN